MRLLPLALVAFLLCLPRVVAADGCFVWTNEHIDITEPEQKAVIVYDEGREDLVLEVKFSGPAREFGWVVPLPSRPQMFPGKARVFEYLSMRTQERRFGQSPRALVHVGSGFGGASSVRVLERSRVGIYDTAVLASDTGEDLETWLRENDFRLTPGAKTVFDEYIRMKWIFVAMRIAPEEADSTAASELAAGTIQPIRFRFETPEPVYPLRISSINNGATDVLLYLVADDQFVNKTCRRATWDLSMCGLYEDLEHVDPDSTYASDGRPSFFISKFRARLIPEEMEDLYFSLYDPLPGLESPDYYARVEAASYIGWKKVVAGVDPLIKFLDRRYPDPGSFDVERAGYSVEQDLASALWALGEIRSQAAIPCLMKWAKRQPSVLTIEALDSLAELEAREALPLFISLMTTEPPEHDYAGQAIRKLALEAVIAMGDRSSCTSLKNIPGVSLTREAWNLELPDPAVDFVSAAALAALAACGDEASFSLILDAIVAGSDVAEPASLQRSIRIGGAGNGYPVGFWIGETLLVDREPQPRDWMALLTTLSLLGTRPALMDSLLRLAAGNPRVPDPGRALLLGCLKVPRPGDRQALLHVMAGALSHGAPRGDVLVQLYSRGKYPESYNLSACAAVYAATNWRDAELLRRMWAISSDADDPTLRGEIAIGLARCSRAEDLDTVVAYVTRDWNSRAHRIESQSPGDSASQTTSAGSIFLNSLNWCEAQYRIGLLLPYFARVAGGQAAVEGMMLDQQLHPAVRLQWISFGVNHWRESPAVATTAIWALREMVAHQRSTPRAALTSRMLAELETLVKRHAEMEK